MVTLRYHSYTVKELPDFSEHGGFSYASDYQDAQSIDEIRKALNDDSISCAVFTTYTGDIYDNLYIGYSDSNTQWQKVEEHSSDKYYLRATLPHGSGIDSDWHFSYSGNRIIASNSYHVMDCMGSYSGWVDFSVYLYPLKRNKCLNGNFTIQKITLAEKYFVQYDEDGNEYNDIPLLREYLSDMFGSSL